MVTLVKAGACDALTYNKSASTTSCCAVKKSSNNNIMILVVWDDRQ